jgi:C1A family cysteine protease
MRALARAVGAPAKSRAPEAPLPFPGTARTPNLPSKVDLRKFVTKVKDQAFRGTCVAHAACAALEAAMIRSGTETKRLDLSEQYLYWACKQVDGAPREEGTLLEYALQVLRSGVPSGRVTAPPGVCLERAWKYVSVSDPKNEGQGPPPPRALKPPLHAIAKAHELKANSIKGLKGELADGRCVGLSAYTYPFWTDGYVWREGILSLPFGIKPDGAHAICLVGYEDRDDTHADGYFIFKNSWGTKWGAGRRDPGYGSLPYRYVLSEAIEAWSLEP